MKIQFMSDIHLELRRGMVYETGAIDNKKFNGMIPQASSDVVILAGDIHVGHHGVEWAIEEAESLRKPIIYVAGNHEFYHREYNSNLKNMRSAAKKSDLVYFLERDEVMLNDVRFLGTTFWTSYALPKIDMRVALHECEQCLNDHRLIRFTPEKRFLTKYAQKLHMESVNWLIKKFKEKTLAKKTVVITHHGPSTTCQHKEFKVSPISAAFHSDRDELLKYADLWVYGHTHSNLDTEINGCRLVSNQAGYPKEDVPDFNAVKIIEI